MLLAICAISGCSPHTLQSEKCDLDNDGKVEIVSINYKRMTHGHPMGGDIIVSDRKDKVIWRQGKLNPWKLQIGDVDGDGIKEIIVGVWKKSPKDTIWAKRTFIYSWNGKRLMPMWLGSRLSRRFDDFTVSDVDHDGKAELIALEIAPRNKHRVAVYRWKSFGVEWLGCSNDIADISSLKDASSIKMVDGKVILEPGRKEHGK